ncbi:hypothetical protein K2173_004890 [Erythroxylum novogranatense]|uniref:Response regulatory domain-containing protein n=1 Tax=Erythroxylum novogranatense TaxID=1862640 RepID=A0AAV8TBD1_9ROSI|nr:hypothetical protein K2173_004890 [Erythroxylum novogranatense]
MDGGGGVGWCSSTIRNSSRMDINKMKINEDYGVDEELHVLAVDDNLTDRKLIEKLLKNSSFQVTTAENGVRALEYLGLGDDTKTNSFHTDVCFLCFLLRLFLYSMFFLLFSALFLRGKLASQMSPVLQQISKVSLIITDYFMPGMTGFELLKKIKESSNMKEVPVVIMSSENIPTRIAKCLEEGAQMFMIKPLKQSDVKKLRRNLINSRGRG